MKLRHLRPRAPSNRNGAQELEIPTSGITSQNHHILQPSQSAVLETTAKDITKSGKGSTGIIGV